MVTMMYKVKTSSLNKKCVLTGNTCHDTIYTHVLVFLYQ